MASILCDKCKGKGLIECPRCNNKNKDSSKTKNICPLCKDKKEIKCPYCQGNGLIDMPIFV